MEIVGQTRAEKARSLIGNFESLEGLDPDREETMAQVTMDAEEIAKAGNTSRLRSLFGGGQDKTVPPKRSVSVKKQKTVTKQAHVTVNGDDDSSDDDTAKEQVKEKVVEKVVQEKVKESVKGKVVEETKKAVVKEKVKDKVEEKVKEKVEEHVQNAVADTMSSSDDDDEVAEVKEKVIEEVKEKVTEEVKEAKVKEAKVKAVKTKIVESKVEKKKEEVKEKVKEKVVEKVEEKQQGSEPKKKSKKDKRRVLIVYAHAFKESYEGCLVGGAVKALKDAGVDVQISNLFEMGFNPVASPQDFGGKVTDKEFYSYSLLAGLAKEKGMLAQDIVSEQDKVDWADLVLVVSQLQSHGFPALLKGWFDRILTYNFAFSEGSLYEKGRLRGKKALLCLTTEALSSMYTPRGLHGDINVYLWPLLNGVLRFAGFDVLKPQVYFGAGRASESYRDEAIETLQERLNGVWEEKALGFIPVDKFDEAQGFVLTDKEISALEKAKLLTVGQHAGKTLGASQLANIVEPANRLQEAAKKKAAAGNNTKKPWYTYW